MSAKKGQRAGGAGGGRVAAGAVGDALLLSFGRRTPHRNDTSTDDRSLYSRLSKGVTSGALKEELKMDEPGGHVIQRVVRETLSRTTNVDGEMRAKLNEKVLMLDSLSKPMVSLDEQRRNVLRAELGNTPVLSKRKRRKLGLQMKWTGARCRWATYAPLRALWCEYMHDVLRGLSAETTIMEVLTKCDWHGAVFRVERARSPGLVGMEGVVVLETENTLRLVTRENKCRVVPKGGCVFEMLLPEPRSMRVRLYGSQIRVRPAWRSARKFKPRPTIDL